MAGQVIAFIPARGGSKSIPLKNIKKIAGQPLIYWTLKAANDANYIDQVWLATDHPQIKLTAQSFNFDKVHIFDRNQANATDQASTESVVLEFLSSQNFPNNNIICLLQATSPLTTSKDIDDALTIFKNSHFDSMLSVVLSKRFFWHKTLAQPINYNYQSRPRRQDFDGLYMENGALYITYVKNLLKYKNRLSANIGYYEMPEYTGIELDEPLDWQIIEAIMKSRKS